MEQRITDYHGKTIAFIATDNYGNKVIKDFHARVLGRYDKQSDTTRDFYGRFVARGDALTMLIPRDSK